MPSFDQIICYDKKMINKFIEFFDVHLSLFDYVERDTIRYFASINFLTENFQNFLLFNSFLL